MESKVKFAGHPVHPDARLYFRSACWRTAVIFDIIYLDVGQPVNGRWSAYYMIGAGESRVGWLLRCFGWLDWFAIPGGTRGQAGSGFLHGRW